MNQQAKDEQVLADNIFQALDAHAAEPDELSRAALRAARYRALDEMPEEHAGLFAQWWSRLSLAGGGAVCAVLLALSLQSQNPGDGLELAHQQAEDAAVIADLDLVLWLEDGDV